MSLDTLIRDVQAHLGLTVDGKPGPLTWAAIHERICGAWPATATAEPPAQAIIAGGTVDSRSETNIATLHPRVQPYARNLVLKAAAIGITIKVTSGLRTYAEQNQLYAQPHDGKDNDGDGRIDEADELVTKAPAGYSNHNFGLAFDVSVFENGKWLPESPKYKAVAPLGIEMGLTWGGSWQSIDDQPHYELRPSWAKDMTEPAMLAELRRRKDSGRDFFA